MRKRMIDPSFWSDEKLGQCTRDERLLFMGLISSADDEGYGRANPKLLRSSLFPYDDLRVSDLTKWLSRLGGLRLIALYEVNGQAYYHLPNFSKHQTINRPTPSSIPKQTEDSLSTHGGLTPMRIEEKRREREEETKEKTPFIPPRGKNAYGEFVTMTDKEYDSLIETVGETGAKRCIEILDNYKGSSGRKYQSDYRAILSWVIARYEEEAPQEAVQAAYTYPSPEEDRLTPIPAGATLADILSSAEEAGL